MKNAFAIVLLLALGACATPTTGDPIVVNAEKTLRLAKDTLDLFVKLEYQNQAVVKAKFPQVHEFAEKVRREAPAMLKTADDIKNAYKAHRNDAIAAQLAAAIAAISQVAAQAQTYMPKVQ